MANQGPKERPLPSTKRAQLFGKKLRDKRHALGISVSTLAERTGYTRAHISGVERGRSGVSADFIYKCDEALQANGSLIEAFLSKDSLTGEAVPMLIKEAMRQLDYLPNTKTENARINFTDLPDFIDNEQDILKLILRIARRVTISGLTLDSSITMCVPKLSSNNSLVLEGMSSLIGTLLSNNLGVDHYMRLEKRQSSDADLAITMLSFLKLSDKYKPYAITAPRNDEPQLNFVLIPDNIAILFMATKPDSLDNAWVFTDINKIKSLARNVALIKDQALPMATVFPINREADLFESLPSEWDKALLKAELKQGDRFIMLEGLSSLTEPFDVYKNRLLRSAEINQSKNTSEWQDSILNIVRARLANFASDISKYHYRDITPLSCLYEYRDSGIRTIGSTLMEPATKSEFRKHIRHVIDLLNIYPNFELALVNDDFREKHIEKWWEAKVSGTTGTVLIEITRLGKKASDLAYVALYNPSIASAFKEHFNQLWDELAPEFRNKDWVIKQLELLIK